MRTLFVSLVTLALTACGGDSAPASDSSAPATVHTPDARTGPDDAARPDSTPVPAASTDSEAAEAPASAPETAEAPAAPDAPAPAPSARTASGQTVAVAVTTSGFEPDRVTLPVGVRSRLVFTRTTDATCATSVKGPALGFPETPLPLGEAVTVEVTPAESGELAFACGMDMVSGVVVAQ